MARSPINTELGVQKASVNDGACENLHVSCGSGLGCFSFSVLRGSPVGIRWFFAEASSLLITRLSTRLLFPSL